MSPANHLCLKDAGIWCLIVLENGQPALKRTLKFCEVLPIAVHYAELFSMNGFNAYFLITHSLTHSLPH